MRWRWHKTPLQADAQVSWPRPANLQRIQGMRSRNEKIHGSGNECFVSAMDLRFLKVFIWLFMEVGLFRRKPAKGGVETSRASRNATRWLAATIAKREKTSFCISSCALIDIKRKFHSIDLRNKNRTIDATQQNRNMAYTAHKDEESMKEHIDPPHVLSEKVEPITHFCVSDRTFVENSFIFQIDKLVNLIRKSKHFVIFTGAGISTDAGSVIKFIRFFFSINV